MKLLPLGTVIKVNNHKVCIIGYTSVEKEAVSVSGYFVVPYPLGFTNIDKTFFVNHDLDFEVLAEGYQTKPSKQVLEMLGKSFEMVEKVSYEDMVKLNQAYEKTLSTREEK